MVLALGPPLAIDGPLPVAPAYSLLTVATIVEDDDPHWQLGVELNGYPTGPPSTWDPCSAGTFRTKDEGDETPTPAFPPFVVYLPITCTASGIDQDTFADRVRLAFQAKESWGVELELSQAPANSLRPHFADADLDILGGGAVSPAVGLSWLEEAIGETASGGVIHAPPAVSAAWGALSAIENRSGRLVTVGNATPVATGGGYSGADPASGASPAAGQSWAFATGPVQIRRTEVMLNPPTLREALDRSENRVTFRAERAYVAAWDTSLQAGVLIDWTP
jgi:hypothetical protein